MNRETSNSIRQSLYLSQKVPLKESQDPAECPICLQSVKVRGKISCCSHIFCYTCIFEWSKITNSCPLCKSGFHEIEKCEVSGEPCSGDKRPHIIRVEDKEQENDTIVQEFIYDDCPFLNEYVEDDFLVSDDAPILYETQMTATSSLVNIPHYDSSSKESIALSLESDSTPPRPRPHRRRQVILSQSQQLDNLIMRRRRHPVIMSDEEEEPPCLFPELIAPVTPVRHLPSLPPTQSYQQDSVLPSEPSATATPILISRLPTVELSENQEPERRCFSDSLVSGLSIIPETPVRGLKSERRCRSESDRFLREKMSHMI